LVFLDESSINYALTRLYGWGEKAERVVEGVFDGWFQRLSVLSTIRLSGQKVTSVFRGTLCKELFADYLQNRLAPSLGVDDVLVLDNSSVHRSKLVCEVFSRCGIRVLFLPRYSSDLNPIELMWSKIKAILRKLKARCYKGLIVALSFALSEISLIDIENWFKHDGYTVKL
jgi:transposase